MTTTSAMFQGRLEGIYLAEKKRESLHRLEEVMAITGRGLEGDRYCQQQGTFSKAGHADREVTLIEMEALEALAHECAINLDPGQTRRNLVTRGVPLNHLVGKEFKVGGVVLRGLRLCEPCGHLEGLTIKGVKDGLCHRGGLRAQIVRGGLVKTGDAVALYQETEHSVGLASTVKP